MPASPSISDLGRRKGKGKGTGTGKGKGTGKSKGTGKGGGKGKGGGMVRKSPASPPGSPQPPGNPQPQGAGKAAAAVTSAKRSHVKRSPLHHKAKLQLSCSLYKRQAKEMGFKRVSNSGTIALAATVQTVLKSIVENASLCAARRRKKRIAVCDVSQALEGDDDLREVLDEPHLQSGSFPSLFQPRQFLMGLKANARNSLRRKKMAKKKPKKKMMKKKKQHKKQRHGDCFYLNKKKQNLSR
eukprot:Rhum_TRINITY_DN7594_c0_g1::Rhum_TRINITY_DN7594_c0_g1_i1::g.23609::m.23609